MKKRLIFFGGTFDPPHVEHVNLLREAKKELAPDKIIVMPTFTPPHKKTFMRANGEHRVKMCELAFGDIEGVTVSTWEIEQGGKSFSYLTMEHLAKEYPEHDIYFLMGTDMLESFHTWKNPELILKYATPLLCERDGEGVSARRSAEAFYNRFGIEVRTLSYVGKELSSTDIKIKKLLKRDVKNCLLSSVNEYIDQHLIYSGGKYADFLIENLGDKRIEHTAGVIKLAIEYARREGVDLEKAVTASLLHDVAKNLSPSDYEGFTVPKDVPPPVVHQYLGAYVAEIVLGIKDKEILNAIRFHTSAKPNMSKLARVVYTADMLEEGRSYEGVDEIRRLSFENFELAFLLSLKRSIEYILIRGFKAYPLTQKAYDYYEKRIKGVK